MDNNNWRPAQGGGEPTVDTGDWRTQLQPESRQRIVNKIMETLKRHLPFSGQEGLQELKKIAVWFEEKIFTGATSQSDYLRKISLKMLPVETKSQNTMHNSLPSNSANNGRNRLDTASLDSTAQTGNVNSGDWQEEVYQKANHALLEEIREINLRLIDTVVDISNEDVDPTAVVAAAAAEGGEGTIVKCFFGAVALSSNLKSQYTSAQMQGA